MKRPHYISFCPFVAQIYNTSEECMWYRCRLNSCGVITFIYVSFIHVQLPDICIKTASLLPHSQLLSKHLGMLRQVSCTRWARHSLDIRNHTTGSFIASLRQGALVGTSKGLYLKYNGITCALLAVGDKRIAREHQLFV